MIKKGKPTAQMDMDGNIIQTFASTQQAEKLTGVWSPAIINCCNGKVKTAGGFKWKYIQPLPLLR